MVKRPYHIRPEQRARIVQALKDGGTVTSVAGDLALAKIAPKDAAPHEI